jgi:hypothetical protein
MKLPRLEGVIERRLLVNYRVDPDVAAHLLPAPFRPQLVNEQAVAGICLLRLGAMRPEGFPRWTGLRSESAAHRVAVEWDTADGLATGVYIPRRDSASLTNRLLGGRVYPGEHHGARFDVDESSTELRVAFTAHDGSAEVAVSARLTDNLEGSRLFGDLAAASRFFEQGSAGYSATRDVHRFDGLGLRTTAWHIEPAIIEHVTSSFFDDPVLFPPGSATLDGALVMRDVPVRWQPLDPIYSPTGIEQTVTSPRGV